MARICDCFGYSAKFIKVDPGAKKHFGMDVTYCYLNNVYVGLLSHCPPGFVFYGITPAGAWTTRGPSAIGCLREYVATCILNEVFV